MSSAQRILLAYGTVILVVGFLLGTMLGALRMRTPPLRALASAHVETVLQAALHLGLAFAVGAVGFASAAATWGASLVVAGSALQAAGATLNGVSRTADQFAERTPGFRLNSVATFAIWPGLVILAWGILTRL